MDRRELLRALIDDHYHANVAEFARAIKKAPSQVHQWLSGNRTLGNAGARDIEIMLNLGQGYFDNANPHCSSILPTPLAIPSAAAHVLLWQTLDDLPDDGSYVAVPHYDVALSAGDGCQWSEHPDHEPVAVPARLLKAKGVKPAHLRALYVHGDSMAPALDHGDTVVIDISRTVLRDDTIFALVYAGELYIKRLFRLPGGGIALHSDNPRHPSQELSGAQLSELYILGEKVWRAG